jgi:hypothetical protein
VLALMSTILVAIAIPIRTTKRDRQNDSSARTHVRRVADAVDAYHVARGSYAGLTSAVLVFQDGDLRHWSYGVTRTGADAWCVDATVGGRTWHLTIPGGEVTRGGCR